MIIDLQTHEINALINALQYHKLHLETTANRHDKDGMTINEEHELIQMLDELEEKLFTYLD